VCSLELVFVVVFVCEERLPAQVGLGHSELKELSFDDWASWSFNMLMRIVNLQDGAWGGRSCVLRIYLTLGPSPWTRILRNTL